MSRFSPTHDFLAPTVENFVRKKAKVAEINFLHIVRNFGSKTRKGPRRLVK
jgi:hypothetical protein